MSVSDVVMIPELFKNLGVKVTEVKPGLKKAIPVSDVVMDPSSETVESTGRVKFVNAGESWTPASVLKL